MYSLHTYFICIFFTLMIPHSPKNTRNDPIRMHTHMMLKTEPIEYWTKIFFRRMILNLNRFLTILCWRHAGGKKTKLGILNSVYSTICKSKHLEAKVCMLIWLRQSYKLTSWSQMSCERVVTEKRKLHYLCYCVNVALVFCFD